MPTVKIVPFPGAQGPAGPQGPQGETGPTGLTGPAGTNGDATAFTPSTPSDWDVVPTTINGALNEIASRLRALGG